MHAPCEIETCFIVPRTPVLRRLPAALKRLAAEVSMPRRRRIEDLLLDTDDMRLAQAGAALRLRFEEGAHAELTLKSLAPFSCGLAQRSELSETLRHGSRQVSGRCPGTGIARRVRPVLAGHPLRICFRIQQIRDVYTVTAPRGAVLLVSVDTLTLPGNPIRPVHMVEIERHSGSVDELIRFSNRLRRLGLNPATESKYDLGLRAAGLSRPSPVDGDGAPLSQAATATAPLAQTFRTQADSIRRHAAGVLLDLDSEALHDMRVACRRLRATLESSPLSVGVTLARHVRDRIVRLTRRMGAVRDFDVFLAAAQARANALPPARRLALASPLAQWQSEREQLQTRLAAILQARPFTTLLRDLETLTHRLDSSAAGTEASSGRKDARTRIRRLLQQTRHLGQSIDRDASDMQLHHLRIHCKRLRYACECLQAAYGHATAGFVRRAAHLQGALGHHQDLSVEARRLRRALQDPATGRVPKLRSALNAMLAQVAAEQKRSHRVCLKAWRRFDRRRSRRALLAQLD